jgi:hypothetical protein
MMMSDWQMKWQHLVDSYKAFSLALHDFLFELNEDTRINIMKGELRSRDRTTAIYMLQHLKTSEKIQLFEELMFLASFSHGAIQAVRDAIFTMPRDFVMTNIERVAEPLLQNGTDDEYRRLLELYAALDLALAHKLAERAFRHEDINIQDVGKDFLSLH